jgi:UDP-3-O-[3-hydroxymyristoyl] glucosamine N-acyltransferase
MTLTVADIAAALGTEVLGDGSLTVARLAEPAEAGPDDLALAMSPKYGEALTQGRARAAVVWPGADWQAMGLSAAIPVGRPRLAMADLTREFDRGPGWPEGIHPTALIDPRADLAADVSVGPYAVIGPDVRIGPGGRIGAHVTIGAGSRLGAGALVHPGVRRTGGASTRWAASRSATTSRSAPARPSTMAPSAPPASAAAPGSTTTSTSPTTSWSAARR